ncbi:MAG TPA: hypothetical protein PKW95_20650 [bacterium]|nr:hypothetical protein [bacterium]
MKTMKYVVILAILSAIVAAGYYYYFIDTLSFYDLVGSTKIEFIDKVTKQIDTTLTRNDLRKIRNRINEMKAESGLSKMDDFFEQKEYRDFMKALNKLPQAARKKIFEALEIDD